MNSKPITIGTIRHKAMQNGWNKNMENEFEDLNLQPKEDLTEYPIYAMQDYVNLPNQTWLIKNIIPEKSLSMIFGPSGVGKSFIAIDIALSVARGVYWNNHKIKKASVIYVAAEGAVGVQNRLKAQIKHYDLESEEINFGIIPATPDLYSNKPDKLIAAIRAFCKNVDLIIFDTLAQVSSNADENSNDINKVLSNCNKIQDELDATVLLIHHTGKDVSRGARGWSGIKGTLDTEIQICEKNKEKFICVSKQKDGEVGQQFPFQLIPIEIGRDEDGDKVTSCIVEYFEKQITIKEKDISKKLTFNQTMLLETMSELTSETKPRVGFTEFIVSTIDKLPYDKGDGDKPKRDRRRDVLKTSAESLIAKEMLMFKDNMVSLPEYHNEPFVVENDTMVKLPTIPHSPHDSIGVRGCGEVEESKTLAAGLA